jgi:hypothetical protein
VIEQRLGQGAVDQLRERVVDRLAIGTQGCERHVSILRGHPLAQARERARHTLARRGFIHSTREAHLTKAQPRHEAHHQGLALARAQRVELTARALGPLALGEQLVGAGIALRRRNEPQARIAPTATFDVACALAARDREEEGPHTAFASVAPEGVVGVEQGLLHQLVGLAVGSDEGQTQATEPRAVPLAAEHEGCAVVAGRDRSDHIPVDRFGRMRPEGLDFRGIESTHLAILTHVAPCPHFVTKVLGGHGMSWLCVGKTRDPPESSRPDRGTGAGRWVSLRGVIELQGAEWPLLIVRISGTQTDHEFETYLKEYLGYLRRGQRYAVVFVTAPDTPMTKSRHARMQADWIKENRPELGKHCAGLAFVLPSAVMRGVLRAILSMSPLPAPFTVASSEEEGRLWAQAQLAQRATG